MRGSKIILSFLVLIFLIAGGYLVLLSQGVVFDFKEFRPVKTGGIFLSFAPREAKLSLNGQPRKLSLSLFGGGAFIANLKPDDYHLRLTAENFRPWEKTAKVEPGLVTELETVFLIPEKIEVEPAEQTSPGPVENFWLTEAGVVYQQNGSLFFGNRPLRGETVVLADQDQPLIVTENGGADFLIDLNSPAAGTNLTALFNSLKQRQLDLAGTVPIRKIFFHPFSPAKFIIFTKAALYELDMRKISLALLARFEKEIAAETVGGNSIFTADIEGNMLVFNLLLKTENAGNLRLEDLKNFLFSDDAKNLMVLHKNGKIEIFDPEKNKQWTLALEKADSFSVFEEFNNYILLLDDGRLIISETQNSLPTNHYELADDVQKYEIAGESVYFLKKNGELKKINLKI